MLNSSTKHKQQGVEILVQGTVQGVGFRPFIYNLACRFGLSGTVTNTGDGVVITVAGPGDRLHLFLTAISSEAPPLARICKVVSQDLAGPLPAGGFTILASTGGNSASTAIPPDVALCEDCRRELLDPADRRFHYPFINCTNCGPRFTIVRHIPYDRPLTSMRDFTLCSVCDQEYHDPGNRRFHAQPNACSVCGPSLSLHTPKGEIFGSAPPLAETVRLLRNGKVLAIRGLGGFHLAVDGCSEEAVALLRTRKGRPAKPLAIMVRDLESVGRFCHCGELEKELLSSPAHPIVLLRKKTVQALQATLLRQSGISALCCPIPPCITCFSRCRAARKRW